MGMMVRRHVVSENASRMQSMDKRGREREREREKSQARKEGRTIVEQNTYFPGAPLPQVRVEGLGHEGVILSAPC